MDGVGVVGGDEGVIEGGCAGCGQETEKGGVEGGELHFGGVGGRG